MDASTAVKAATVASCLGSATAANAVPVYIGAELGRGMECDRGASASASDLLGGVLRVLVSLRLTPGPGLGVLG